MESPVVTTRSRTLGIGKNQWLIIKESTEGPASVRLGCWLKNLSETDLAEIAACCVDYLCETGYVRSHENNALWSFIVDSLDNERYVEDVSHEVNFPANIQ